jgi:putative ABC transport system permease protein
VKINGVPVDRAKVATEAKWAVESDRGLTYAAEPPVNTKIVAGSWWPAGYKGPPLVSLDRRIAEGMGIGVGDTLTVNVLGTEIEARIANLRAIDWSTLGINFTIVFAPGALESLPQTHIATVRADPAAEDAVEIAVTDALPNVSAIRVRDALEAANRVLGTLEAVLEAMAFVTVALGLLVLAGAVAATRNQRLADSVVLRVLGARRRDLLGPVLVEFGALGLCAGALAVGFGVVAAHAVVTRLMHADWAFRPAAAAIPAAAGVLVTVLFGFAGTRKLLKVKPLAWLRNE